MTRTHAPEDVFKKSMLGGVQGSVMGQHLEKRHRMAESKNWQGLKAGWSSYTYHQPGALCSHGTGVELPLGTGCPHL